MKIIDNRCKLKKSFMDINRGDVFRYRDEIYIKIFMNGDPYGVSLCDGNIAIFECTAKVELLEATLTIDG